MKDHKEYERRGKAYSHIFPAGAMGIPFTILSCLGFYFYLDPTFELEIVQLLAFCSTVVR